MNEHVWEMKCLGGHDSVWEKAYILVIELSYLISFLGNYRSERSGMRCLYQECEKTNCQITIVQIRQFDTFNWSQYCKGIGVKWDQT